MKPGVSFGDLVAISAIASILGGFSCGFGFVAFSFDNSYWSDYPGNAAASSFMAGVFGLILGLFTAWPLGVIFGEACRRMMGGGKFASALAGAITGLALASLLDGFRMPPSAEAYIYGAVFPAVGSAAALLARYQVVERTAVFKPD